MKPVNQTTQPPGIDAAWAGSRTGGARCARSHALPAVSCVARAVAANAATGSSLPAGGSPADDGRRLALRLHALIESDSDVAVEGEPAVPAVRERIVVDGGE